MCGSLLDSDARAALGDWECAIPYLRLAVSAKCLARGCLPNYLGSTLRGVFGQELLAGGEGLFEAIFNPPPAADSFHARQASVSPAFVLDAPLAAQNLWAPGDRLRFGLTLLGPALRLLPELLAALDRIFERGLGAPDGQGRVATHAPSPGVETEQG